jgi:hypothetical protein
MQFGLELWVQNNYTLEGRQIVMMDINLCDKEALPMSSDIEHVIREVEILPPEDRLRLIGRIVETMLSATPQQPGFSQTGADKVPFHQLRGKYRDLLPSTEEIARWKQDEIDLEDRRS